MKVSRRMLLISVTVAALIAAGVTAYAGNGSAEAPVTVQPSGMMVPF